MSSSFIQSEIPCKHCGYNLRGLPVDHICPECGAKTIETILETPSALVPEADDIRREFRARKLLPVAELARCSIDAVMFVADAIAAARSLARVSVNTHINALQVCEGVRAHAHWYFNDVEEAKELLQEWGIHGSEDVGRIIFAMNSFGFVRAGEKDSIEQFNGLFTLETLLATPT